MDRLRRDGFAAEFFGSDGEVTRAPPGRVAIARDYAKQFNGNVIINHAAALPHHATFAIDSRRSSIMTTSGLDPLALTTKVLEAVTPVAEALRSCQRQAKQFRFVAYSIASLHTECSAIRTTLSRIEVLLSREGQIPLTTSSGKVILEGYYGVLEASWPLFDLTLRNMESLGLTQLGRKMSKGDFTANIEKLWEYQGMDGIIEFLERQARAVDIFHEAFRSETEQELNTIMKSPKAKQALKNISNDIVSLRESLRAIPEGAYDLEAEPVAGAREFGFDQMLKATAPYQRAAMPTWSRRLSLRRGLEEKQGTKDVSSDSISLREPLHGVPKGIYELEAISVTIRRRPDPDRILKGITPSQRAVMPVRQAFGFQYQRRPDVKGLEAKQGTKSIVSDIVSRYESLHTAPKEPEVLYRLKVPEVLYELKEPKVPYGLKALEGPYELETVERPCELEAVPVADWREFDFNFDFDVDPFLKLTKPPPAKKAELVPARRKDKTKRDPLVEPYPGETISINIIPPNDLLDLFQPPEGAPTMSDVLSWSTTSSLSKSRSFSEFYIYMRDVRQSVNYLDFWMDVAQHMTLYGQYARGRQRSILAPVDGDPVSEPRSPTVSRRDIRASAKRILYTFLFPGAEREIAIPDHMTLEVTTQIKGFGWERPGVFDQARDYVFLVMERDAFPGFLYLSRPRFAGSLKLPSSL